MLPKDCQIMDIEVDAYRRVVSKNNDMAWLVCLVDEEKELEPRVILIYCVGFPVAYSKKNLVKIAKFSISFHHNTETLYFYVFELLKHLSHKGKIS